MKIYYIPCTKSPDSGKVHFRYVYKKDQNMAMYEQCLK